MEILMVNQDTVQGQRAWVYQYGGYAFTIKQTKKGLVATAPIDLQTSALGKKWDLPGDWRLVYASAYADVGRRLAKERHSGQLSLF